MLLAPRTVAQEESLCRSSGLYPCIQNSVMYEINEKETNFIPLFLQKRLIVEISKSLAHTIENDVM